MSWEAQMGWFYQTVINKLYQTLSSWRHQPWSPERAWWRYRCLTPSPTTQMVRTSPEAWPISMLWPSMCLNRRTNDGFDVRNWSKLLRRYHCRLATFWCSVESSPPQKRVPGRMVFVHPRSDSRSDTCKPTKMAETTNLWNGLMMLLLLLLMMMMMMPVMMIYYWIWYNYCFANFPKIVASCLSAHVEIISSSFKALMFRHLQRQDHGARDDPWPGR